MQVVLVHGWGFDAIMWGRVRQVLSCENKTIDLGFFGSLNMHMPTDEPVLAVGHSLGLLWLLTHAELPAGSRVIGINGFARFSQAPDFPQGVAPRVLERMQRGLTRDASAVLTQFRKNCGNETAQTEDVLPEHSPDIERLSEGLRLLREGDARARMGSVHALLASRDDTIVAPAMTEAGVTPSCIQWEETGGHLLPLTAPTLCATFISDILNEARSDGHS
ncbi:alpha/beta hydrolase [Acetobacter estunensis]|nr:alpha/beta hydrolase [Acetobacter estunensis]